MPGPGPSLGRGGINSGKGGTRRGVYLNSCPGLKSPVGFGETVSSRETH